MGETRNRNSVRVNEEGKEKLLKAKAKKNNYDDSPLTFLEIATKAGVSEKTVKRFFAEEFVSRSHAEWIAEALDLELTDLIDAKATTPPPEILATLINWREVCSAMLEPHRRISSNFLMQDECARKDKEQIYVPLALVQRTKTDKRDKGNFSPDVGTRLYEPQYETQQRFEHEAFLSQILEGGEGKTKGQQIAVIGEPGAGKTTLLQTIAFWVLEKNLGLPVWISLADLGRNGTLTDIQTYICNSWLEQAIPATQLTQEVREDFTNQIQQRRVWLLLDGVDEMSEASHQPLEEISCQLNGWLRSSRVVLTCRMNVWQADVNALETFETYRLLDFDYPQQVHQFIDNWFGKESEKGERLKTELDSAERLRLRDLVQTPLRLALLCGIWQTEEGNLPETKAGLYHQCVQQFYRWKQNRFRTSKKEQHDLNQALGRLALRDINEGSSRFRLLESFISEELGDVDDETSLFYKAWQLGWLNHVGIAAESSSKEKVYAFYHATFEEYFAALAVDDDWHYFLKHVPENPEQGIYRIFEPQWKEIILIWLGREEVIKEQKEQFIKILVEFKDDCWTFYQYRAFFLAAAGIAEFRDCSYTDWIVEKLVEYAIENNPVSRVDEVVNQAVWDTLQETNRSKVIKILIKEFFKEFLNHHSFLNDFVRTKVFNKIVQISIGNTEAIDALTKLINDTLVTENFLYEDLRNEAAFILGKIDYDKKVAIDFLKQQFLNHSLSESIRLEAALFLGKMNLCNQDVIKFFTDFIKQNNGIYCFTSACSLQLIDPCNTVALDTIYAFLNINKSDELLNIPLLAACLLIDNNPNHTESIRVLRGFLCPNHDKSDRLQAAYCLGKVEEFKQEAVDALYGLLDELTDDGQLQTAQDRYFAQEVCFRLHQIEVINLKASQSLYQENTFSKFDLDSKTNSFTELKNMYAFFSKYSNKDEFKEIYSVILWEFAQNMSYQDFYYAIHIEPNEVLIYLKQFNL